MALPTMIPFKHLDMFKFWCQKVLPTVYDDSLSYYELLCKVVKYLNDTMEDTNIAGENITKLYDAFSELKTYVDNFIDNVDIDEVVEEKLNDMLESGELADIVSELLQEYLDKMLSPENGILDIAKGESVKIGFLGDSITYGYIVGTDNVQSPKNYPAVLSSRLTDYNPNVTVVNYGQSGWSSNRYIEQFNQALSDGCNMLFFMFGHNDFRLGGTIDTIIKNVNEFIHNCYDNGITPIVCSINPYYGTDIVRLRFGKNYANILKQVCEQNGCAYVPVYEMLQKSYLNGTYSVINISPDGIHLNDYTPIADIICGYLFKFMCAFMDNRACGWRNSGLSLTNVTISDVPLTMSYSGRVANLKSNSTLKLKFYSPKPFILKTLTCDYVASALASWKLVGATKNNETPYGVIDGEETFNFDYHITGEGSANHIREIILFNGQKFGSGYYELTLDSLTRGAAPNAYTPLLYLVAFECEPVTLTSIDTEMKVVARTDGSIYPSVSTPTTPQKCLPRYETLLNAIKSDKKIAMGLNSNNGILQYAGYSEQTGKICFTGVGFDALSNTAVSIIALVNNDSTVAFVTA